MGGSSSWYTYGEITLTILIGPQKCSASFRLLSPMRKCWVLSNTKSPPLELCVSTVADLRISFDMLGLPPWPSESEACPFSYAPSRQLLAHFVGPMSLSLPRHPEGSVVVVPLVIEMGSSLYYHALRNYRRISRWTSAPPSSIDHKRCKHATFVPVFIWLFCLSRQSADGGQWTGGAEWIAASSMPAKNSP